MQRSTTFAWGYYLLVAALLLWAAGLALVFVALRRRDARVTEATMAGSPLLPQRNREMVAALLGIGVMAWGVGTIYLPWVTYRCPPSAINSIHYICISGSVNGNIVYDVFAHDPNKAPSYAQLISARLVSPSILDAGNDLVFGSLVPFSFIILCGLGAAFYALWARERRRRWGYWAYLGFVTLVTFVIFARTRTLYDETTMGTDSLGVGVVVTALGLLLMGAAVALLFWYVRKNGRSPGETLGRPH
jgi:hypothetical protein